MRHCWQQQRVVGTKREVEGGESTGICLACGRACPSCVAESAVVLLAGWCPLLMFCSSGHLWKEQLSTAVFLCVQGTAKCLFLIAGEASANFLPSVPLCIFFRDLRSECKLFWWRAQAIRSGTQCA